MTLLLKNEDLFHFSNVEDAFLWMEIHQSEDPVIILGELENSDVVEAYIQEYYPLEIIEM